MSVHWGGRGPGHMSRKTLLATLSQYAAYALALPFKTASTDGYWVGGTKYATLPLVPGYTYTRSGQVGFVNSGGTIDYFAANVPPVEANIGYEAYGGLTNYATYSQQIGTAAGGWTPSATTTANNVTTAPDGTTTAGSIIENSAATVEHNVAITNTMVVPSGALMTHSIFAKQGPGTRFLQLWMPTTSAPVIYANYDLTNGTVTATNGTAYIVACANGWKRCVLLGTMPSTSDLFYIQLVPSGTSAIHPQYTGDGTSGIYVWGMSGIQGGYPGGGPYILTTNATAAIGANALSMTLANGTYSAVYTFDDASTQTISTTIAAGVFTMPNVGTLNRPVVRLVTLT